MELLVALPALFFLPFAAMKGRGYRGLYLAVAIGGFLLGAFLMAMPMGPIPGRDDSPAFTAVLDRSIVAAGAALLAAGLGGLLGACLYRAPQR